MTWKTTTSKSQWSFKLKPLEQKQPQVQTAVLASKFNVVLKAAKAHDTGPVGEQLTALMDYSSQLASKLAFQKLPGITHAFFFFFYLFRHMFYAFQDNKRLNKRTVKP